MLAVRRPRCLLAALAVAALLAGCSPAPDQASPAASADAAVDQDPSLAPAAAAAALLGPWQPEPIPLWPGLIDAVAQACRSSMPPFPASPLVAVDARGQGHLQAAFSGPAGDAVCMDLMIDAQGRVEAMGGGSISGPQARPPLAEHALMSMGQMSTGGGDQAVASSLISGVAGPGIRGVVVEMPGQPRMTATLANGWYLLWWPGPIPAGTKVIGLDVLGAQVAESDP